MYTLLPCNKMSVVFAGDHAGTVPQLLISVRRCRRLTNISSWRRDFNSHLRVRRCDFSLHDGDRLHVSILTSAWEVSITPCSSTRNASSAWIRNYLAKDSELLCTCFYRQLNGKRRFCRRALQRTRSARKLRRRGRKNRRSGRVQHRRIRQRVTVNLLQTACKSQYRLQT